MSTVGERIKALRLSLKMSQAAFAKRAGIGQSTLCSIETSTKSPSTETVRLIANAFGTTVSELMGEEKEATADNSDSLRREVMFLYDSLPPDRRQQAADFLRFLADTADKSRP